MSYRSQLLRAEEGALEVSIDRCGASSKTGIVQSIDEDGVTLKTPAGDAETAAYTYIEFTSIRGITTTGWDIDAIDG